MRDQKYNGWANRATWIVSVWLYNDEKLNKHWTKSAANSDSIVELASMMQAELHDMAPEMENMYGDLLEAILEQVEWYEIAENMWNEAHCA